MTENVLFDLDGTLVDTFPGIEEAALTAIREVMPDSRVPALRDFIGPPIREIFSQALGQDNPEILDRLGKRFRALYNGETWQNCSPYRGVLETLISLRRSKVRGFVVTNKPTIPTMSILMHLQMNEYFDDVVSPDSRQPAFKSKTEMTDYIITKHALVKGKTLLVGDSLDDALAAQSCELRFVAVTYGYGKAGQGNGRQGSHVIGEFSELLNLI